MPGIRDVFFDFWAYFQKAPHILFADEAHDILNAGAVVPTAVENDDFAGGREMLDVALKIHLRFLTIGRRWQRHDPEDARAHPFGDGFDGAALACGVAALKQDDDARSFRPSPSPARGKARPEACGAPFRRAFASSCRCLPRSTLCHGG